MSKKILLVGTHGQYNWGDDLLLETFLARLGSEHKYFVNSYDPEGTLETIDPQFDVSTFHTTKDRLALIRSILSADIVFFAGGTILRELYKTSRRNTYSSLLMVATLIFFAKRLARKTVIMSNVGAGPIETSTGRRIAKFALDNVDFVAFRDAQSLELARSVGTKNENMIIVPDAIYSRPKTDFLVPKRETKTLTNNSTKKPLVLGLNLNFDIANPSNWEVFMENLASSVKLLAESFDLDIRGIPMQTAFNPHNDIATLNKFGALIAGVKFSVTVPKKPRDIGTEIAKCDIIVAERLHALIIASIIGIPFVALEYDVKITSLARRLGMSDYSVDINRAFKPHDIADRTHNAFMNTADIKKSLAHSADGFKKELDEYFETIRSRYM